MGSIPPYPARYECVLCGALVKDEFAGIVGAQMKVALECFRCAYWETLIGRDRRSPDTAVIADGRHYVIEANGASKWLAGFGGKEFDVEFFDGRCVRTRNLWCQGEIPSLFRDQLMDNASVRSTR